MNISEEEANKSFLTKNLSPVFTVFQTMTPTDFKVTGFACLTFFCLNFSFVLFYTVFVNAFFFYLFLVVSPFLPFELLICKCLQFSAYFSYISTLLRFWHIFTILLLIFLLLFSYFHQNSAVQIELLLTVLLLNSNKWTFRWAAAPWVFSLAHLQAVNLSFSRRCGAGWISGFDPLRAASMWSHWVQLKESKVRTTNEHYIWATPTAGHWSGTCLFSSSALVQDLLVWSVLEQDTGPEPAADWQFDLRPQE